MAKQQPSSPRPPSGIEDLRPWIEMSLDQACDFGPGCPEVLAAAMRYALLAPGKRLRPALVLMSGEACGVDLGGPARDRLMPGAVAVEMVHAYSLIHDDLPAMDDDDLRRGRPTVHIKFDEATAILAGDALQAEAFRHLATRVANPIAAAAAMGSLAQAASASGLVGGQADDLAAESRNETTRMSMQVTAESGVSMRSDHNGDASGTAHTDTWIGHLESIHRRKTGALFAASLDLGAILAGADEASRAILGKYAGDLGLAFQVVDDLLDHTADEATVGKRVGKDADRGKLTYPGLLGLAGAQEKANELVESAKSRVSVFGDAGWRLTLLADYVLERTH
nr:polyprenyl synthetase family protein [Rubripirellula tenax]